MAKVSQHDHALVMKRILPILACLISSVAFISAKPAGDIPGLKTLAIGDAAPDFSLKGIDGEMHTLANYESAKVLVVAFISNHCPDSQAAEGRLKKLVKHYSPRGVSLVAINPNHPDGLRADELGYSKYNDSYEEMILHAKEQKFNFPYLNDGNTQTVAKAYGCLATPHVFIFDADRKLQYKGELDDSRFADPATVKRSAARDAIDALLDGKPVPLAETRPHGCSTKWLEKKASVGQEIEKWDNAPVDIELIDAAGVATLRKNGTQKLRLINVWSTSCAPCIQEFPELIKISRKFGMRQFEFITISLDHPQQIAKSKAFLEKHNASLPDRVKPSVEAEGRKTNNYLYNGANQDALVEALDPEWPGPIPHTVLVAPDGSIVWRHNGMINGDELRAKILKILGRYYQP